MLEIAKKCNRLDEAFLFLYLMANDQDIAIIRSKNEKNIKSEKTQFDQIFDLLTEIEKHVKNHLHLNKERVDYLFKEHGKSFSTLASASILWNYRLRYETVEEYHKRFTNYSDRERILRIAEAIDDEAASAYDTDKPSTIEELIVFISENGYDSAAGFEMLKLCNHHEAYFTETNEMLEQVMKLLNDCNEQIAAIELMFFEYWTKVNQTDGILDIMTKRMNVSWKLSTTGIVVIPVLFNPLSASLSIDPESNGEDVIHIGAGIEKDFLMEDASLSKEDIISAAKVFADKSKVDILEFIKDKPAYGKEIADHLKLTTATISYHMNALITSSFVKTSITSGKVYYQLDREKIEIFSKQLAAYFM